MAFYQKVLRETWTKESLGMSDIIYCISNFEDFQKEAKNNGLYNVNLVEYENIFDQSKEKLFELQRNSSKRFLDSEKEEIKFKENFEKYYQENLIIRANIYKLTHE